jgi:transposase
MLAPEHAIQSSYQRSPTPTPEKEEMMELQHARCCGLDVHKDSVVACVRLACDGKVTTEVRTFGTTTAELLRLSAWLAENECTHVAMEATGVYWKPVWHILDDGEFVLILANAAHVKNVPGRKTDVKDGIWLAELVAHGLIRPSFVPDHQTQEMRTLLSRRLLAPKQSRIHTVDSAPAYAGVRGAKSAARK